MKGRRPLSCGDSGASGWGSCSLGVAGFLLSACGGGGGRRGALATRTDATCDEDRGHRHAADAHDDSTRADHGSAGCPSPGGRSTATAASPLIPPARTPTACSSTTSTAAATATATPPPPPAAQTTSTAAGASASSTPSAAATEHDHERDRCD